MIRDAKGKVGWADVAALLGKPAGGPAALLALDANFILTPPCIFHE
jgi:hypothetical protein